MKKAVKFFKNRISKYCCFLFFWFVMPFIASAFFKSKLSDEMVILYLLPYVLFLMISFMYEGHVVAKYLALHYPNEAKRLSSTFYWRKEKLGLPFLLSFSPDDAGWKAVQSAFKKYLVFAALSLLVWIGFAILYFSFAVSR